MSASECSLATLAVLMLVTDRAMASEIVQGLAVAHAMLCGAAHMCRIQAARSGDLPGW